MGLLGKSILAIIVMGRPSSNDSRSPRVKGSREKSKHKSKDREKHRDRDKDKEGREHKEKHKDKDRRDRDKVGKHEMCSV